MRFTMSKDGVERANVRVQHRLSREDLVDLLCLAVTKSHVPGVDSVYDESDLDVLPERLHRDPGEIAIRDVLRQYGADARHWWRDDVGEDVADVIRDWAEEQVGRWYR